MTAQAIKSKAAEISVDKMSVPPKRQRFTTDDDILLLREIVANDPFANSKNWNRIQEAIQKVSNKNFSIRALREHFHRLLKAWKDKDDIDKKRQALNIFREHINFCVFYRSGVEEVYNEKHHLLQELYDLSSTVKPKKQKKISIATNVAVNWGRMRGIRLQKNFPPLII